MTSAKLAVVTGAAKNIGAAITNALIKDGWSVVAIDRDGDAVDVLCREAGPSVVPMVIDLAECEPTQLASEIVAAHGPVSGFVANAGVASYAPFLRLTPAAFDYAMAVNLRSHLFMAQGFARHLVEQRMDGAFVFVSSVHQDARRRSAEYSASKAAIAMLVREVAADLGPHGIRINAVAPGLTKDSDWSGDAATLRATPIGRPVRTAEVADVVTYLMSDRASAVTGANWTIDGGLSTHSWADDEP